MKLQMLQILQIFIQCRNVLGGASVHISKHIHFYVSRSRSVARRVRVQAFDVDCALCGVVWYVWCVYLWMQDSRVKRGSTIQQKLTKHVCQLILVCTTQSIQAWKTAS